MKIKTILYLTFFLIHSNLILAQSSSSTMSVSLIGGTHGIGLRGEIGSGLSLIPNSRTTYYLDLTAASRKFTTSTFPFNGDLYPSAVWIFNMGLGVGQEFDVRQNIVVIPYLGFRLEYARFKDGDLVTGIGTDNLIRTYGSKQVGPTVENGYGNSITVDIGSRIGYKISSSIEIGGLVGFSPIKYSTANTLFGKYWGATPITNDYYINRSPLRFEAGIKFSF